MSDTIQFYEGAPSVSGSKNGSTQPDGAGTVTGGPVKTFEGGNDGKGVKNAGATKSYYALDSMPSGGAKLVETPLNVMK